MARLDLSGGWTGIPGTDFAVQNKNNNYLINPDLQSSGESFTGIRGLGVQDCGIQESMGPIADWTIEHLGFSLTAIIKLLRMLPQTLSDLDDGAPSPGMNPVSYRVRSACYKMPKGEPFEASLDEHVRITMPAYAK